MNKKINILIVHYNTPRLTECLVKSINKFVGANCTIYIFDNSDKNPFTYKQDNIVLLDNTQGQIINFDKWLEKYPYRIGNPCKNNNYASAKHCYTIEKCFDLINDNFILIDSDILLKQDVTELYDENYFYVGEVGQHHLIRKNSKTRVHPYLCFINVNKCKNNGIHYFDENHMLGINKVGTDNSLYETGSWFFKSVGEREFKKIYLCNYIVHFGSASFNIPSKTLCIENWLHTNKRFWVDMKNKRVIYTCITGGYENIVDPSYVQDDFDYVCFTDNMNQSSKVWQFRPIPNELQKLSKVKQQRVIKICPHKYLPEYYESIWVDGSIDILGDMNEFIETYCNKPNKSVYIRKHPKRNSIYEEATACVAQKKDVAKNVYSQTEKYRKNGFPTGYGLVESNIIYRKHNDPYCIQLMNKWVEEVINGSHRDQLSFNYALWKKGDSGFQYIDSKLSNSKYFKWYWGHNRK